MPELPVHTPWQHRRLTRRPGITEGDLCIDLQLQQYQFLQILAVNHLAKEHTGDPAVKCLHINANEMCSLATLHAQVCLCSKTTNTNTLPPTTGPNNGSRSLLAAQLAAQLSLDGFFPVLHIFFLIAYSGSWVRQTRAIKTCHVTSATHVCMLTPATIEQHAAHVALLLVACVICETDFTDKTNVFDSEPYKAMSANMLL